jgi:hypothetical protein
MRRHTKGLVVLFHLAILVMLMGCLNAGKQRGESCVGDDGTQGDCASGLVCVHWSGFLSSGAACEQPCACDGCEPCPFDQECLSGRCVDGATGVLVVWITVTTEPGAVGAETQFRAHVSLGSGVVSSYEWTFGDGAKGSGPEPTHIYDSPGTYVVHVTAQDSNGVTGVGEEILDVH